MRAFIVILSLLLLPLTPYPLYASTPTLTIYTYDGFFSPWGPGPLLQKQFEAQCNCKLTIVALADAGLLLTRLQLEGEKTKADVILGLDNQQRLMPQLRAMLSPLSFSLIPNQLPIQWNDPYFLPIDWSWFAFVYDDRRVSNPPHSLAELAKGNYRIVIEDPRTSSPGLGLLLWIKAVYGDQANQYWNQLKSHIVTVTPSWSQAYGFMLKGEADLALSYTTSPAYHLSEANDPHYHAAIFTEGHLIQVETVAIAKTTQQPQLAQNFIRYLASSDAQAIIMKHNWMYPAFKIDQSWPEAFTQLPKPSTTVSLDETSVSTHLKQWITQWQQALSQ